ncbi:hypothetical protein F5Y12DRAFT_736029 [Xylaria sp. FL1777]|nr:hypothetical protein F5Y12DRAFT_736029 [Xylaria sp. FL1777]
MPLTEKVIEPSAQKEYPLTGPTRPINMLFAKSKAITKAASDSGIKKLAKLVRLGRNSNATR